MTNFIYFILQIQILNNIGIRCSLPNKVIFNSNKEKIKSVIFLII